MLFVNRIKKSIQVVRFGFAVKLVVHCDRVDGFRAETSLAARVSVRVRIQKFRVQ